MAASIELAREGASALISPTGASLRSLTVDARPVVVSVGAFDGAVLAPWPNRIAEGRFVFDGSVHRLPITEPQHATALHGLVAEADWTVLDKSESSVRLEFALEPTPGYPFSFGLGVEYRLHDDGLRISAEAHNTGSRRAPFGFGFHPWLAPGAGAAPAETVDDAQLVIPAETWVETDERLIPTEFRPFDDGTVIPADHAVDGSACIVCKDFRGLRTIGGTVLDDAYFTPRRGGDGWSRARLRGVDDREIAIGMGSGFRTWQVCTGDDLESDRTRKAIAIEPMTCPPNAFASGTEGDDFDVVEPGGRLAVEWSVSLLPDSAG